MRILTLQERQQKQRSPYPTIAVLKGMAGKEAKDELTGDRQRPRVGRQCLVVPIDELTHRRIGDGPGVGGLEDTALLPRQRIALHDRVWHELVAAKMIRRWRVVLQKLVV